MIWCAALLGLYVLVNVLVYAVSTLRYRRWCARQPWTATGLLPAAEPFVMGEGKDAVLLVHGFNDVPYVWTRMAPLIAAKGYHVAALRLPGFGTRHPEEANCLADWREPIATRLRELAQTHQRVFLCAHSMGCALAIDAAVRVPAVAGLILLAPLFRPAKVFSPIIPFEWRLALHHVLLPLHSVARSMFREHPRAQDDPDFTYGRDGFMRFRHLQMLFGLLAQNRRRDKGVFRVPALVMLAGEDQVVDPEATRQWFADYPAPHTLEVVPGAKHAIPQSVGWQNVVTRICAFMADTPRCERDGV